MPKTNSVTHLYVKSYKIRRNLNAHLKVAIKCIGEFLIFSLFMFFFFFYIIELNTSNFLLLVA